LEKNGSNEWLSCNLSNIQRSTPAQQHSSLQFLLHTWLTKSQILYGLERSYRTSPRHPTGIE